jgi:hypothetical protein
VRFIRWIPQLTAHALGDRQGLEAAYLAHHQKYLAVRNRFNIFASASERSGADGTATVGSAKPDTLQVVARATKAIMPSLVPKVLTDSS